MGKIRHFQATGQILASISQYWRLNFDDRDEVWEKMLNFAAMKRRVTITAALLVLALAGCRYINYHPYDVDISGATGLNKKNTRLIEERCLGRDTIVFAATGDTQGWYDETEALVKDLNKRPEVMFLVHDGDFTDFGAVQEYKWQRAILSKLRVPYVACIGNHDCLGTGKETFERIYGKTNFAFIAGGVKFLMLNTNALEYDYSEPIPDLDFIERQERERAGEFDRTIVVMHAKPYSDVFNNNVAKPFQRYLHQLPGLLSCINGHNHSLAQDDIFGDGLVYYQTPCIAKRQYYIFTITPNSFSYEVVSF